MKLKVALQVGIDDLVKCMQYLHLTKKGKSHQENIIPKKRN